ncbi:hypothetical protein [Corynebacterium glutamicum]|uniref:hypothetical protein n=1 Tax=Corynebacterium glutamicum TaxID=1718 RepID=UPI001B8C27F4|nr:hypothetical protein [Corynebacterium glutamicum]
MDRPTASLHTCGVRFSKISLLRIMKSCPARSQNFLTTAAHFSYSIFSKTLKKYHTPFADNLTFGFRWSKTRDGEQLSNAK